MKYDAPKEYDNRFKTPLDKYVRSLWYPYIIYEVKKECKDKVILDLGCGTCEYLKYAEGARVSIGIDISISMLKYGYRKIKNLKNPSLLILSDAYNLPLKSSSTDLIIAIGLLEYVDPEKVINECRRVLKTNGKLIVLVPNKCNIYNFIIRFKNIIKSGKHFKEERSIIELKKILKRYGYKIIKIESFGMITYCPIRFQRHLLFFWKLLDRIWRPFQKYIPLGNNLFIKAVKLK